MKIEIKKVEGFARDDIPDESESIADSINIEPLKEILKEVRVYLRSKEDCPFNRGNWVIDLILDNGQIFCYKLPSHMTEEQITHYLLPLLKGIK